MAVNNLFVDIDVSQTQIPKRFVISRPLFIVRKEDVLVDPEDGKSYYGPFRNLSDIKNIIDNNSKSYSMIESACLNNYNFLTASTESGFIIYSINDVVEATKTKNGFTIYNSNIDNIKSCKKGVLTITIDNKTYIYKNIDLTKCVKIDNEIEKIDIEKIAQKLNNKVINCEIYLQNENTIIFESKTFGVRGDIVLSKSQNLEEDEKDILEVLSITESDDYSKLYLNFKTSSEIPSNGYYLSFNTPQISEAVNINWENNVIPIANDICEKINTEYGNNFNANVNSIYSKMLKKFTYNNISTYIEYDLPDTENRTTINTFDYLANNTGTIIANKYGLYPEHSSIKFNEIDTKYKMYNLSEGGFGYCGVVKNNYLEKQIKNNITTNTSWEIVVKFKKNNQTVSTGSNVVYSLQGYNFSISIIENIQHIGKFLVLIKKNSDNVAELPVDQIIDDNGVAFKIACEYNSNTEDYTYSVSHTSLVDDRISGEFIEDSSVSSITGIGNTKSLPVEQKAYFGYYANESYFALKEYVALIDDEYHVIDNTNNSIIDYYPIMKYDSNNNVYFNSIVIKSKKKLDYISEDNYFQNIESNFYEFNNSQSIAHSFKEQGKDASGFDLTKLSEDNIFEIDFQFTGFTTSHSLDLNTILNVVKQIDIVKKEQLNRSLFFAYQISSYKDSIDFHNVMKEVDNYKLMIAPITALISNEKLLAQSNGAFLSCLCSKIVNETGVLNGAISLNGKEISGININNQKINTQIAKEISENIALYTDIISFGKAIKISDFYYDPMETSYINQIIETTKIEIANIFKMNNFIAKTNKSLTYIKNCLLNKSKVFLENNVLNTDVSDEKLNIIPVLDKKELKKSVRQNGIYFEFPLAEDIETNIVEYAMVIPTASGISKIKLHIYEVK